MSAVAQRLLAKQRPPHGRADPVGSDDHVGDHRVGTVDGPPPQILWRDCPVCGWRTYPEPVTSGSVWSTRWEPAAVCDSCGELSRGDERDAQSEEDRGDTEPDRSPKTKLRSARRRFATASPNEEEPLGAALNPPFSWCPNNTKCRPRQSEATDDEEHSADYHASNVPG
jgi:hypothetical protein